MARIIDLLCVDGTYREATVLSVSEVIELEQQIASEGTSLYTLMQRAGAGLAEAIEAQCDAADCVIVLAGSGNNGGDGWVAARILADLGYKVKVISRTIPAEVNSEPARTAALEAISSDNLMVIIDPDQNKLEEEFHSADLIVDAILGTGFAHEEVREPYASWIEHANLLNQRRNIPIIAADCPSGLNAQTGTRAAQCIKASITVTMLAPKCGLIETSAQPFVGQLILAPLI